MMKMSSLSDRLQMAVRRMTGRGTLTEKDIDEMLREVRLSLLEADVNFRVVRNFTNNIKEQALGEKILKGLNPGQQVVKIVHEELKRVMGTSIGKLAVHTRKIDGKKPFIIAADIYRPAAIDQLKTIGKEIGVTVYDEGQKDPRRIVKNGLEEAKKAGANLVIIDTAGRLHIDEEMMQELVDLKKLANPNEILLTVDAMTGQDAANIAKSFHDQLETTGAILTKLDGDTRGGAALSIREVSGIPIKFASSGEKMDTFEAFHPERMASRILGMGDVLTLIERAEEAIDEDEAMSMMEKLANDTFNYNDLLKQFKMMKRMGSLSRILGFIPGLGNMKEAISNIDDKEFYKMEVLISSMTEAERKDVKLLERSASRRKRVALGAGMQVADLNRLREALKAQKEMMKKMTQMDEDELKKASKNPSQMINKAPRKQKKGKGKGKGNFRYR
jgi:signal recognition particle subunit SRP54